MTLGQKLKALLKDNSMTQEDLAERLEVSRQAVGKWVNGSLDSPCRRATSSWP